VARRLLCAGFDGGAETFCTFLPFVVSRPVFGSCCVAEALIRFQETVFPIAGATRSGVRSPDPIPSREQIYGDKENGNES